MSSSSSSSYPSLSFQPICPNGSKFFACTTGTKFIGCCTTTLNPCTTSSGCAPPNLKAASFSPDAYGTFPDQECPAGSLWYTCKETRPPFWGCCRVNACAERGCVGGLGGNLSEAFLSSNSNVAAAFLSMVESSYSASTALAATTSLIAGTSATASSSSSSVAAATTSTTAPPMTTTSSSTSKNTTRNIGAIVGGTVAGVAVVVAFLLVLFFLYRCRKAAATTAVAATATAAADGGGGGGGGTPMSIISHQQSPFNTQQMLDNNQNTHPALRKPETSPVAAVEEQGFKQSVPNMGESQFEAYSEQSFHLSFFFSPYSSSHLSTPTFHPSKKRESARKK